MANGVYLDFERPIVELEEKIEEMETLAEERGIDVSTELSTLQAKLARLKEDIFSHLTPIQRVQLARHPRRPYQLQVVERCFPDWLELHSDRAYADEHAMIGGMARFDGQPVIVIGQQKGRDTKENLRRNFGMPHPEGYRKALRLMKTAEKFGHPVIALIDTPGAYPGTRSPRIAASVSPSHLARGTRTSSRWFPARAASASGTTLDTMTLPGSSSRRSTRPWLSSGVSDWIRARETS